MTHSTAAHRSSAAADGTVGHLPPRWTPTPVVPSLPIGVAVLAVLIAIAGLVVLLAGILYLLSAYFTSLVPATLLIVRSVDPIGAVVLVVLGAILLSVATALWRLEAWALWTTVVALFLAVAYLFFTASITVLFLLLLLLFIYLLTVRHHFF